MDWSGVDYCGLLWCFYQLFGLSFWRHPFTAHWSQTQFLEGHSSAQFSSNQLQITPAWKFLVILKTLISWVRCVWLGLKLNCAELWPPGIEFETNAAEDPLLSKWCNATFLKICSYEETNSFTSWMAWGRGHAQTNFIFMWTIPELFLNLHFVNLRSFDRNITTKFKSNVYS